MRITFVLPELSLSGGVKVVALYAKLLQTRGHKTSIVYTPAKPISFKDRVRRCLLGNRAQDWMQGGRIFFNDAGVGLKMINRWRPVTDADVPDADVVVATWWETAEWVRGLSIRKGAKAYFIQSYEVWGGDPVRVDATWRSPLHKIVISRCLADLAAEKFGDRDCSYVPNGVDFDQFHAPARGKRAEPTVGLVYSHRPFKGYDVGLKAVELISERIPNLRVKCFGVDDVKDGLPLPAGAEFVCRPAQEKIREIYGSCDAWLFTSRLDGFGLPILESMACRTPVIGTPAGAAPELIGAGGGILVPMEDAAAMAEAAIGLLQSSEEHWREVSDAAYATALEHSWDKASIRMERALDETIEKQRPYQAEDIKNDDAGARGKKVLVARTFGAAAAVRKN